MSRIMVVEDEPVTAADLEERLTALGHQVTWFDNGADALAQAQTIEPDLVLMDIRLRGDLSGIDTAQRRANAAKSRLSFSRLSPTKTRLTARVARTRTATCRSRLPGAAWLRRSKLR